MASRSRSPWCAGATPQLDGENPTLLYGYGAYELSTDPDVRLPRLSMLDRGFVFAIAHVRGGGEMGREWYEDGKILNKTNTFTDFIACAEHWSRAATGAATGSSIARRQRRRPADGRGREPAARPVRAASSPRCRSSTSSRRCSTRRCPSPSPNRRSGATRNDAEDYEYMKAYSPYDNVRAADYPAMLVIIWRGL